MESESLSLQDEGEQSGDVIMSDNDIDPNYEPSEDEVLKYAIYLGIDPEEDKDFLYIAREGLKAPVAKPWRACQTRTGEIYYFNFENGESQWDHPSDDIFRKKFQELKALCNNVGNNKRGEQKLFRQMQKKQHVLQASGRGSTILEEQQNECSSSNFDISGLHKDETDKENIINLSDKKSPEKTDFDDNQLSLDNKDDTENKEYNLSHEPSNLHDIAQSFENFENFDAEQSDIKLSTKKHEFLDSNIIQDASQQDIPETRNFYDEGSLHHGSTVNIDFGGTKKSSAFLEDNEEVIKKENSMSGVVPNGFEIKESQEFSQGWGSKISPKQNEGNGNSEEKVQQEKMFYEDSEHQGEQAQNEEQEEQNDNAKRVFSLGDELIWDDHVDNKLNFESGKEMSFDSHEPKGVTKALETGSINFSAIGLEESAEKKQHKKRDSLIAVEELENDFSKILREYEEDLGNKFSEILGEYEQEYQNEAMQIQEEYQNQIVQIRMELEQSPMHERSGSFDNEVNNLKKMFSENNAKEIDEELKELKASFDQKKREIEEMNHFDISHQLSEIKKKFESDLLDLKEDLEDKIEDNLEAIQKIKQETYRGKERIANKGEFSAKKRDVIKHIQDQIYQLEAEQNEMLEQEAEVLKVELEEKMENEKALLEEAYKHSQEELMHLKVQIAESFKKNLEEEKNKLHTKHEKAIKQLEIEEIAKAEEIAVHKAQASLRGEFEKKFNAIQIEKMLYEKQSKKRLEEIQLQALKHFEAERMGFEEEINREIKHLDHEVNSLGSQISVTENRLSIVDKQAKEMEGIESEIIEGENIINQLAHEISELEIKEKDTKTQINSYQAKLYDFKRKLITKNHTVNKINDLHHQLDSIEQEIGLYRERLSHHRASQGDYSSVDTFGSHSSSNNINRLLKEVEEIKSFAEKRAMKKSSSANRMRPRHSVLDAHNRTVDNTKIISVMHTEDGNDECSKLSLDEEPTPETHTASKILRHSQDAAAKRGGHAGSMHRFLEDKRPKEQIKSHSYTASAIHNQQDSFQKPKYLELNIEKFNLQTRNEWKAIIDAEKKSLEKYTQNIYQRKIDIREIQEQLKKEQEQYKVEYSAFKNSTTKSSTKKLQLEIFKKALNDKIYEYNRRLCQMRDRENILKTKKEALKKLETALKEATTNQAPNQTVLSEIYHEYRKLSLGQSNETNAPRKSDERSILNEKHSPNSGGGQAIQNETGHFNLNLSEVYQKNKPTHEKHHSIAARIDEGSKENYQSRANNNTESKVKTGEKMASAIFQRKFLRKPSPTALVNYKNQTEQTKGRQDYSNPSSIYSKK